MTAEEYIICGGLGSMPILDGSVLRVSCPKYHTPHNYKLIFRINDFKYYDLHEEEGEQDDEFRSQSKPLTGSIDN